MNLLVCPSGFKGSLEAHVAADCIEKGIRRVDPGAKVRKVPLADGGEGFARALTIAKNGEMRHMTVTGPVGAPIPSFYGILREDGSKTAVIEIAAAAGLSLVPMNCRNPCVTTSYGVGQLISAALEEGVQRIIIGCGDSGISDGGAGMLQALGVRFIGVSGIEIPKAGGGQSLISLAEMDFTQINPHLNNVQIEVACNWQNVLCGPNGVARVYGPQKGATPDEVELLAASLDRYASVVQRTRNMDVADAPGSGASGGLGTAFLLIGAELRPRYEAIMEYFNLDGLFDDCDLVFTAEGGIDFQTPRGKIPSEVALRAKKQQLPVIVLAGTIGVDADVNYEVGINAYASILQKPMTLDEAMKEAEKLLMESAECAMRMVVVGRTLERLAYRK